MPSAPQRRRRVGGRAAGPVLATLLALAGVACTSADGARSPRAQGRLDRLYAEAVAAAAVAEPRWALPLPAVTADPVTAVSWTGRPLEPGEHVLRRELWVTVAPALQARCRELPRRRLELRLQQLLGLPPDAADGARRRVAVVEVPLAGLVRPCADPDPRRAGPCPLDFPAAVPPAHRAWIAVHALASYRRPRGYPWTRLGYTFDWHPRSGRQGLAEYVIPAGTAVRVLAVVPATEYCGRDAAGGG